MNRHLWGAPSGLPLSNLQSYILDFRGDANAPHWTQNWSAKIVEDELFLSAVHKSVFYDDSIAVFREHGNSQYICPHIRTISRDGWYEEIPELKSLDPDQPGAPFIPRRILRSCSQCLTDIEITIARVQVCNCSGNVYGKVGRVIMHCWGECGQRDTPHAAGWQVTIAAYHQVGSCRSPKDWKWRMLARPSGEYSLPRDMAIYPSGAVVQKWEGSA